MSQDNRPKGVKDNTVNYEELRRKRADGAIALRKERKDKILNKKRDIELTAVDLNESVDVCGPIDAEKLDKRLLEWESGQFEKECSTAKMAHYFLRATNFSAEVIYRMAKCVPLLTQLTETLRNEIDDAKPEAARIFDTIIADNSEYIENVEAVGAIDVMVQLLAQTSDPLVARYCVSALGNYMGDNSTRHIYLIQKEVIPNLVGLLKKFKSQVRVMSILSWALVNVSRDPKSVNNYSFLVFECIFAIEYLILMEDEEILENCCTVLEHLTGEKCFTDMKGVERVLQSGVIARLILLLEHSTRRIAEIALNAVGNILYSGEEQAQVLITHGVIPPLVRLLQSGHKQIVAESLWSLSNISAGSSEQIQELIEAGIIPEAIKIIKTSLPVSTRKEAAWILTHIARSQNLDIIKIMQAHGSLQALSYVLSTVDRDPSTVLVALRGLRRLLKRAEEMGPSQLELFTQTVEQFGGKIFIENYIYHENGDISDYANNLIDDFWKDD